MKYDIPLRCRILLPSFTRDGDFCLSFSFNMYGYHVNMLRVAKLVASGQLVTLWKMKGQQGPHWQTAQFNVDLRTADQVSTIVDMASCVASGKCNYIDDDDDDCDDNDDEYDGDDDDGEDDDYYMHYYYMVL